MVKERVLNVEGYVERRYVISQSCVFFSLFCLVVSIESLLYPPPHHITEWPLIPVIFFPLFLCYILVLLGEVSREVVVSLVVAPCNVVVVYQFRRTVPLNLFNVKVCGVQGKSL